MKRILIVLALSMMIVSAYAQERLSFKGISIEGSVKAFCEKLQTVGFTKIASENNLTLFSGDFIGNPANVAVAGAEDGGNVLAVVVMFDQKNEWNVLKNLYDYCKGLYTKKYGEPTICKEENPREGHSNIIIMAKLSQGEVTWGSCWNVPEGVIELSINKGVDTLSGAVVIKYLDGQNYQAKVQNDLDDI